jgi:Mrp family chromosome partitioning ATPase
LLQALSDGGVDVTVISGPPLLEEADATIVAWATRNVLWAIIPGEVTRAEARAAAARMELAGVTPFGVVMVEPQTIGVCPACGSTRRSTRRSGDRRDPAARAVDDHRR